MPCKRSDFHSIVSLTYFMIPSVCLSFQHWYSSVQNVCLRSLVMLQHSLERILSRLARLTEIVCGIYSLNQFIDCIYNYIVQRALTVRYKCSRSWQADCRQADQKGGCFYNKSFSLESGIDRQVSIINSEIAYTYHLDDCFRPSLIARNLF